MDICDDASATETKFQQMALANHMAGAKSSANTESQTHCMECGEEIPQGRREAVKGCTLCITCQEQIE